VLGAIKLGTQQAIRPDNAIVKRRDKNATTRLPLSFGRTIVPSKIKSENKLSQLEE